MLRLGNDHLAQVLRVVVTHPPLGGIEMRDTLKILFLDPQVNLQVMGPGDPLVDEGARLSTVDPANQLTDDPAKNSGGIPQPGSWLPPQWLGSQDLNHVLPVIHHGVVIGPAQRRYAGGVGHDLAHGDPPLAALGKLGPVAGHRRVELQLALLHQHQGSHCGQGLDGAEGIGQGAVVPRLVALQVRHAGPQVDHGLAADLHTEPGAALLGIIEHCLEGVQHGFETLRTCSLRFHSQNSHPSSCRPGESRPGSA